MAKSKTPTLDAMFKMLDIQEPKKKKKSHDFTLGDAAVVAGGAAYIGWFFGDYLKGDKKAKKNYTWRDPFQFPSEDRFSHHTDDKHLHQPTLVSKVSQVVTNSFTTLIEKLKSS